jgi:serine/threonine protein kinase
MQDEIAAGKYGPIRKCIELRSNRLYAAKHMSQLRSSQLEQALQELDTLNGLRHPHVISLNDAFRFKRDFILILEL